MKEKGQVEYTKKEEQFTIVPCASLTCARTVMLSVIQVE